MDPHKILVLRLSAVGDVIRTLPAVQALKTHHPSSIITWIVEEPSRAFLESQPEIDEVILFPRKRWTDGMKSRGERWRTAEEVWRFVAGLRRQRYDLVLDFHGILKSGLLSLLSASPKRIGFDRKSTREGNFLFSNIRVKLRDERVSRFERNFTLLKGLGLDVTRFHPQLYIPAGDREYVEPFFESLSKHPRPWIAIHPGTSPKTVYKRWMPHHYAALADRLTRKLKAVVIFTWGPGELHLVERIQKEMEGPSYLSPRTESLTQLGEVFRRCDLYIGGDTGPMHIASLSGIPVVAIFGPTDPVVNEPLGKHRTVRKEVGCSPCRTRSCKELICLKKVTVEDVFEAVKEVLNK